MLIFQLSLISKIKGLFHKVAQLTSIEPGEKGSELNKSMVITLSCSPKFWGLKKTDPSAEM